MLKGIWGPYDLPWKDRIDFFFDDIEWREIECLE
jgi:hypothetical protein